ncbi:hypothetical protein ACRRS0_19045 [Agarivorans sp. QJM3NY_29]|uniref:hypothetical protein n=1 Tax=unclassified Agarivorans TaxID=2636026 RepID=UPI003D7E34E9
MKYSNNRDLVRHVFKTLFSSELIELSVVERFFSKTYRQYADGHQLNYEEFYLHLKKLKNETKSLTIEFKAIAEQGSDVLTHHYVHLVKQDNSESLLEVLAHFQLQDGKITGCWESCQVISGSSSDHSFAYIQ